MIRKLLSQHASSVAVATFCSLLLGAVSTVLFSLVGPALQVILNPSQEQVSLTGLFGANLGSGIVWLLDTESVTTKQLWQTLPFLLCIFAIARGSLTAIQWCIWEQASERMAAQLRKRLVSSYLHIDPQTNLDYEGFDQRLSTILTTDVKLTREYIIHFYGGLPREVLQVVFYLATLVLLSPQLFLVFVLGIAPAGIVLSKLGKKVRSRSAKALNNFGQLGEWLQQRLLGVETIKQFGMERYEVSKLTSLTSRLNDKFLKTSRVKARTAPMMETIAISVMVGILYLALDMVSNGVATGSVLMSFFSILGILSQSAAKLGRYYNSNKEGGAAVQRIVELESFMSQNQVSSMSWNKHSDLSIAIKVDNLTLQYPGHDSQALQSVSFEFKKGSIYCLCGPSGAGKSSMFSILLGLAEPTKGRISFSSDLNRGDIGYLPQIMHLAPTTLRQNLSYPLLEIDDDIATRALEAASGEDLCSYLGNDSVVATDDLSGGQLQRIFLARLFYNRFPIVLIDEGTSALDPENEAAIYRSIKLLAKEGAAVIMIAHRLSSMQIADQVLLLEGGVLKTYGKFDQLKNQKFFEGL